MVKSILTTTVLLCLASALEALPGPAATAQTAAYVDNRLEPVMVPDQTWEGTIIYEPTVLRGVDGIYRMWYGGGSTNAGIGFAVSSDGIHFAKYAGNPIIGHSTHGIVDAAHSNVAFDGSTYYIYFAANGASGYGLYVCTSPDGVTLSVPKLILRQPSWAIALGNTFILKDGADYWLAVEAQGPDYAWRTGPAHGTSYLGPFSYIMAGSLSATWASLDLGGSYGGPWLAKDNTTGLFHIWYHASKSGDFPTDIWHATSPTLTDQWSWTRDSLPLLTHTDWGWTVDQVADPALVVGPDGRAWMYYAGLHSVNPEIASIGVAVLH